MKHNVYDFDKTIYLGDSTFDFYLFCIGKEPLVLVGIPAVIWQFILFCFGMKSMTELKSVFFTFLKHLEGIDALLEEFWDRNQSKIAAFYMSGRRDSDIIASASPEFLLKPMMRRMGLSHLFASQVDRRTGHFNGVNCKGAEKVRRLREAMPDITIGEFYSDSLSDQPLAELSEKAFIVKNGAVIPWSEYRPNPVERMIDLCLDRSR